LTTTQDESDFARCRLERDGNLVSQLGQRKWSGERTGQAGVTGRWILRRSPPRGRPPKAFGCRKRIEPGDVGEQRGDGRIEPGDVVDHQSHFGAARAEPGHVGDHQGPLDAESASNPATWSSSRPESASNPRTWSTTRALSVHRAPTPAMWSTTLSHSMHHVRTEVSASCTCRSPRLRRCRSCPRRHTP
jgi:hypothetical protein